MNIGSFLGCGKSEIQAYSVLSREERDRVNGNNTRFTSKNKLLYQKWIVLDPHQGVPIFFFFSVLVQHKNKLHPDVLLEH